jgi:quercetin dioxygenase-like cupin family protein
MHQHENEDEMFLVIEGKLLMQLEHKTVEINAGEFVVVPKTNHRPVCWREGSSFEPNTTVNRETLRTIYS